MKKLQFTVEIEFEDEIEGHNHIHDVAMNVLQALQLQSDSGEGLAPEDAETFPIIVSVTIPETDKTVSYDFMNSEFIL